MDKHKLIRYIVKELKHLTDINDMDSYYTAVYNSAYKVTYVDDKKFNRAWKSATPIVRANILENL